MPNGAQALIRTLVNSGVTTCFTNPGTSEMHFVAALDSVPEMRAVLALFEGVATGAADGYARMSRCSGGDAVASGPGLGNGLANLHNARRANVPIVNIVGDHATYHTQYDAPLQSDIETVARNVSAWVRTSKSTAELARDAVDAVTAAIGPPGQVATLILPADVSWSDGAEPVGAGCTRCPDGRLPGRRRGDRAGARRRRQDGRFCSAAGRCVSAGCSRPGGSRPKPAQSCSRRCFRPRLQRGAGLPAVERIAYVPEVAMVQLGGLKHLVLVDAKAPVSFFAYPGKKSYLVPEGCELHELAAPDGRRGREPAGAC